MRRAALRGPRVDAAAHGVDLGRATVLLYALMGADGALREFRRGVEGEPLHALYKGLASLASIPDALRPAIGAVLRMMGWGRAAGLLQAARARSTVEYWALVAERDALRDRFLAAWRAVNAHCLITVGFGVAAFGHGESENLHPGAAACFIANVFALPAGAVPVTRVRAGAEEVYKCPVAQRDLFAQAAIAATRGSAGLPVGVQVMAPPFEDELALRGMRELERALAAARGGGGGGGGGCACPETTLRATLEAAARAAPK